MVKFALFPKDSLIRTFLRDRRQHGIIVAYRRFKISVRSLLPKREYIGIQNSSANAIKRVSIETQRIVEVPSPRFFGWAPLEFGRDDVTRFNSPKLEVAEFLNVAVMGGTDLLFQEDQVIYPDFYHPDLEVCAAETFKQVIVNPYSKTLRAALGNLRKVKAAISLISQCEGNYAHFLVEVLPRLALLEEKGMYPGIPILMARWSHPNIRAAMESVNRGKRKVIFLDRWETIKVERLINVSPPAYIVADHRDYVARGETDGISKEEFPFSRTALVSLRNRIIAGADGIEKRCSPSRIYVRRNNAGNARKAKNAAELERAALQNGFLVVEPSSMDFASQVALFRGASIVAGQVGAALVNTLFSNRGCSIIALSPYFPGGNYYFWSNFAGTLGHYLLYVIGNQIKSDGDETHIVHRDYEVSPDMFQSAITEQIDLHKCCD